LNKIPVTTVFEIRGAKQRLFTCELSLPCHTR